MATVPRPPRTVLIVEDDDAVRTAVRDALVAEDYKAISVSDLGSARRAMAEVDFDVVLLDLSLERESGVDLLDELSTRPSSPPVVIVSARRTAPETARSFAVPLVAKPFGLDRLLAVIDTAIDTRTRPRAQS